MCIRDRASSVQFQTICKHVYWYTVLPHYAVSVAVETMTAFDIVIAPMRIWSPKAKMQGTKTNSVEIVSQTSPPRDLGFRLSNPANLTCPLRYRIVQFSIINCRYDTAVWMVEFLRHRTCTTYLYTNNSDIIMPIQITANNTATDGVKKLSTKDNGSVYNWADKSHD